MITLAAYPLQSRAAVNSPFGPRGEGFHGGIDLDADTGDPLIAVIRGRVSQGWDDKGGGNWSTLTADDGTSFGYGHASSFAPGVNGTTVEPGTVIAYAGSTGDSTGPHLHFAWHPSPADLAELQRAGIAYHAPYADPAGLLGVPTTAPIATPVSGPTIGLPIGIPNPLDALNSLQDLASVLSDSSTWLRALTIMGGLALIVAGVLVIKRDTVLSVAVDGAKAAATGGASVAADVAGAAV